MLAWKAHEHIEFNFTDCQLQGELNSENEAYIKRRCRERLQMAGTYVMLIGQDTRYKHKYVRWEAEVALEKGCRIIGVNLDGWRRINPATCPPVIRNVGAMFVPFSPQIIAHALQHADKQISRDWEFKNEIYYRLGYQLHGDKADRPPRPFPFH